MNRKQLVDPSEVNELMDDKGLKIVDCRFDLADVSAGRRSYETEHLPGAVFLDLNVDLASAPTERSGRHPLPEVTRLEETLGRLGIGNTSSIVVYDSGNGAMAARAWWIFRWLGHTDVRLLDGGISAWKDARLPLCSDIETSVPAKFVASVRNELVITTEEIVARVDELEGMNLMDARDASRFAGEQEPIDKVAGHVPGARNLPFPESLDSDGRWKGQDALLDLWRHHLGNSRQSEWVAMCGSGVTACHLVLSAVEAGYREPRLYVGSWSEWITDPGRPVALGTA